MLHIQTAGLQQDGCLAVCAIVLPCLCLVGMQPLLLKQVRIVHEISICWGAAQAQNVVIIANRCYIALNNSNNVC